MENIELIKKELEYWNSTAIDLLEVNKNNELKLNESKKIIEGLLDDFNYFIGNTGIEPDRAGYILEAEKYLKQEKTALKTVIKYSKNELFEIVDRLFNVYAAKTKQEFEKLF